MKVLISKIYTVELTEQDYNELQSIAKEEDSPKALTFLKTIRAKFNFAEI